MVKSSHASKSITRAYIELATRDSRGTFERHTYLPANDLSGFDQWKRHQAAAGKEIFRSIAMYSERGHKGQHQWPGLVLDIDCEDDVETARRVSVEIIETVTRVCGLDPAQVCVAFSGAKGFHLVLRGELFGPEGNRQSCRFWKFIAHRLRDTYPQICPMIYSVTALLRLSGSINYNSGLFKVPLEFAELRDLSAGDITAMAKSPRHEDVWVVPEFEQRAERWLDQQIESFHKNINCSASHLSLVLSANNGWVTPHCVRRIEQGEDLVDGERHDALFALAVWYRNTGMSRDEAEARIYEIDSRNPVRDPDCIARGVAKAYEGKGFRGCPHDALSRFCDPSRCAFGHSRSVT